MVDVVIIGGGPAGSAAGCYLSQRGISNLILESAVHPRPHVGESLVPSTYDQLAEIGFMEVMKREGFIRKVGASWHPTDTSLAFSVDFTDLPPTYHVDRARFDELLLRHARTSGSEVRESSTVQRVLFADGAACGVRVKTDGVESEIPCRVVVDASGRSTVLGRQLGWKQPDPQFNQFAVHTWYEGVDRGERPHDIHIYFLPVHRGWAWQIPITDTATSIGVVAEKTVFKQSGKRHGAWFESLLASAPDFARAMGGATRIRDFTVEADYSYSMKGFVGDGFVLVGDAARFVDPIFSSGVSIALASAKFASAQIADCLAAGDLSAAALRPYEKRLRRGTEIWYEFICLYYRLLPMFTLFIRSKQYGAQVLELLQGDVYDRDTVPVLDVMRRFAEDVENGRVPALAGAVDSAVQVPG